MITLDTSDPVTPSPKSRLRKVYSSYYDREFGKPHPMIRMHGKYLTSLGFGVGDAIEVQFDFGRITISKPRDTNEGR